MDQAWLLRLVALTLSLGGVLAHSLIWLIARRYGSVTLHLDWWPLFERWIEPFLLLAWLAIIGWAIWREISLAWAAGDRPDRRGVDG